MSQRLQQLQTALGEHTDSAPATVTALPTEYAPPAKSDHGKSRTLFACLLSAALGASTMWLAMQDQTGASAAQLQPTAVAIAPSAIVSPALQAQPESMAPAANRVPDETQIGDLVESWRQAWQSHDLTAYLAAYGGRLHTGRRQQPRCMGCCPQQETRRQCRNRGAVAQRRHRAFGTGSLQCQLPAGLCLGQLSRGRSRQDPGCRPRRRRVEDHSGAADPISGQKLESRPISRVLFPPCGVRQSFL